LVTDLIDLEKTSDDSSPIPSGINPLLWALIVSQIRIVVKAEISPLAAEFRDMNQRVFVGNGHMSLQTQLALLTQRLGTMERMAMFFGAPLVVAIVGLIVAILTHKVFP